VAPFDYSRLLFSALFGLALFAEVPDVWTMAGAALIVASTIYIARREAMVGASS
jgi:drug/metabolite transporter (DMT)-like permease